ncbi:MAG: GH32 C-terminal domain-containing protein, partial [Mycobacterium leprae]
LPPFAGQIGEWRDGQGEASPVLIGRAENFGYATTRAPQNALIHLKITAETNARRCGLLLHTDSQMRAGYQVTFDLAGGQFAISSFAPEGKGRAMTTRRPMIVSPDGTVDVTVLFADDILEVYVNDRTVLTNRLCDHQGGEMGLFVEEGTAFFADIEVRELPAKAF